MPLVDAARGGQQKSGVLRSSAGKWPGISASLVVRAQENWCEQTPHHGPHAGRLVFADY